MLGIFPPTGKGNTKAGVNRRNTIRQKRDRTHQLEKNMKKRATLAYNDVVLWRPILYHVTCTLTSYLIEYRTTEYHTAVLYYSVINRKSGRPPEG